MKKLNYTALGQRIRDERRKRNLTQEELANAINVTFSYIGQMERAERGVSLETLINLSNYFDVTVDYLLSDCLESDEYYRQLWIKLVKDRPEKELGMIINVVKAIVGGLE